MHAKLGRLRDKRRIASFEKAEALRKKNKGEKVVIGKLN
jgi:hypothetical protein